MPITGATVIATGSNGSGSASTDSYGRYQIAEGLGTGDYSVTVTARGYIDAGMEGVEVVSGQETSGINFYLKRSGSISGRVTGLGGLPLRGVLVLAMQTIGGEGNASSYALTAADGSYTIDTGLSTGTYNVTAGLYELGALGETLGYIPQTRSSINVAAAEETSNVDFQLETSGLISGRVTTTEETPLVGLMVMATSSDERYFGFTFTTSGGIYRIASGLGTGNYNVMVLKGLTPSFRSDVLVTAGQETPNIDFQISITPSGTISGRVTNTLGNPIGDASVYASGLSGYGEGKTDIDGYYAISEGLGTGDYTVFAEAPGYSPSPSRDVYVTVGQETCCINFQLQKLTAQLSGKISGQVTGEAIGPPPTTTTTTPPPTTTTTPPPTTTTTTPPPTTTTTPPPTTTTTPPPTTTTTTPPPTTTTPSRCIIATATYGSELSPEVQFLRGFRDQLVLQTFAGRQFMELFNAWYYSFSPGAANFISEHPVTKTITKASLYPLIGILHLSVLTHSALSFNSELGITAAGLVASSLIGAIYFSPPLAAMLLAFKRLRNVFKMDKIRLLSIPWMISVLLILIGEVAPSPLVTMVATGMFVLTTLATSAATGALGALKVCSKLKGLKR